MVAIKCEYHLHCKSLPCRTGVAVAAFARHGMSPHLVAFDQKQAFIFMMHGIAAYRLASPYRSVTLIIIGGTPLGTCSYLLFIWNNAQLRLSATNGISHIITKNHFHDFASMHVCVCFCALDSKEAEVLFSSAFAYPFLI